jgi:5S rRNA maturation endonuclease (ribonuclease M5)
MSAAPAGAREVLIVEGEKDVERLVRLGRAVRFDPRALEQFIARNTLAECEAKWSAQKASRRGASGDRA